MSDIVTTFLLVAATALLAALLSRVGISRRITLLQAEVDLLRTEIESNKVEFDSRMRQSRLEFAEEVRRIIEPINARMETLDTNTAQISSYVSSLVNSSRSESHHATDGTT